MSYNSHIRSPNSLITPPEETRAGFISIALEKNKKATSLALVKEAEELKEVIAASVKSPEDLLNIDKIRDSLITAAGISDKAKGYFREEDKIEAITEFIERFLEPSENFIDELIYRFLLTKGDALGGSMRNLVGKIGEMRFTSFLIQTLSGSGRDFKCLYSKDEEWREFDGELDLENLIKGLHWTTSQGERVLIYNLTVPFIKKNVDLCLLDCSPKDITWGKKVDSAHKKPKKYLALGELKGGIDPAGADERWKTAKSALGTIRKAFDKESLRPYTFFIGAAIENAMAEEIYRQLEDGTLTNSANLTNKAQVEELCNWLTFI